MNSTVVAFIVGLLAGIALGLYVLPDYVGGLLG